jgi:hypothetical protein
LELSDEEKQVVDKNIAEIGTVQLDSRGLIDHNTYIKIHCSFLRNGYDVRNAGEKEHVAKRRELLKNDDSHGYAKEIQERLTNLKMKTSGMQKYAFAKLNL